MPTLTPLPASMRAKQRLIRWHQDPRGGWIEVPRFELERLCLTPSTDSYEVNGTVYLDDNADGTAYLEALKDEGTEYRLCPCRLDFDHPVRCMTRCHQG